MTRTDAKDILRERRGQVPAGVVLTRRERRIVAMYFEGVEGERLTIVSIAERLGVSDGTVSRTLRAALDKIGPALEANA